MVGAMSTFGRETWGTRIGFILAAVGSAVGLGNIWRFPYLASDSGGGAFLVVYLIAVLLLGVPAILVEFVIGRRENQNVIDAYRNPGNRLWKGAGVFATITTTVILAYYCVVGGWVLRYIVGTITGSYFGDPSAYFNSVSTGLGAIFFTAIFISLVVIIVGAGVERGIEVAVWIMVPGIIILLIGIAVWASGISGTSGGYEFYLGWNPEEITGNLGSVIPAAVGQALFSLSLGHGIMITYASYLGENHNLTIDGVSIAVLDTITAVLAGLVVFPLLFAVDISPGTGGTGAIFVSMATAFGRLPGGIILGIIFFGVVALGALTSAISTFEVLVSYLVDKTNRSRPELVLAYGVGIFLFGIPTALNTDIFLLYDSIVGSYLLPLGAIFATVFVGWVLGRDAVDELQQGASNLWNLGPIWLWYVRTVIFVALVGTLALSVIDSLGVSF